MFHRIEFPAVAAAADPRASGWGISKLPERLIEAAIKRFDEIRALPGLEKKPATAELLGWTKVLSANGIDAAQLERLGLTELPAKSALLKTDADVRRLATRADSAAV